MYREAPTSEVDLDNVSIEKGGTRPAQRRFGRNVPDHQSMSRSGETAVCDQGHGRAQTHANNGRGHLEHLPHARPASRAFISNDDNITRSDLSVRNSGESVLLSVEH